MGTRIMVERTVRIGSTHGLHARPAKLFTQAAAASGAAVTISKSGGKPVNGASILAVISQDDFYAGQVNGDPRFNLYSFEALRWEALPLGGEHATTRRTPATLAVVMLMSADATSG